MKYQYIDSLRGWAIIGVITIHSAFMVDMNFSTTIKSIAYQGSKGVELFFMLSALTLMLSASKRRDDKSTNLNFFIRRFFRIAPMYYTILILCQFVIPKFKTFDAGNISSNFLFLHGFFPTYINKGVPGGWSVGLEMIFYAIFPLMIIFITSINRAIIFTILGFALRIVFFLVLSKHQLVTDNLAWKYFLGFNFINHLPVFGLGFILYFLIYDKKEIISPTYLLLLVSLILYTGIWDLLPNKFSFEIGLFILIYSLSQKSFILLVNPVLVYIGKISFSLYLTNQLVILLFSELNLVSMLNNSFLNFVCFTSSVFLLSVIISSATYFGIEKPCIKFGNDLINKRIKN